LVGFISPQFPHYFVWESGQFKKGSLVLFRNTARQGKILGVCGFGRNYVLVRVHDLERDWREVDTIQ